MAANQSGADARPLFWSEHGAIGCERHIPYQKSDTWIAERWIAMTYSDRLAFAKETGRTAKCECCNERPSSAKA